MKIMSFKKKALVTTGIIASVGGVAWFLTQTEKGRQLSQKAKDKLTDLTTPAYHVEEYTFVFKEPYDYEKEPYHNGERLIPNGQVIEYSKKDVSPKFLNMRPVFNHQTSETMTRERVLRERRLRVAKLFKEGYTVKEIAHRLILSEQTVLFDLSYLQAKHLIKL